jgi:hypothetical protein
LSIQHLLEDRAGQLFQLIIELVHACSRRSIVSDRGASHIVVVPVDGTTRNERL